MSDVLKLNEVKPGEKVLIFRRVKVAFGEVCKLDVVATVTLVQKTRARAGGYWFRLKNGEQQSVDPVFYFRRVKLEELPQAEAELERIAAEEEAEDERKRQAEYDALPEEIKLARKLDYFCNNYGEDVIAKTLPLQVLRDAVAAILAAGKETD